MQKVEISINDLQDLVIYAQRYAIGRKTYAPKDVSDVILKHLDDLDDNTIKVIIDDIHLQTQRNNLGEDMDKTVWLDLLATLKNELSKSVKKNGKTS